MLDFNIDLGGDIRPTKPAGPPKPKRYLLKPVPEEPGNYVLAIDNSSLERFQVCGRSAEYYLVHGREFAGSSAPLSFGGCIHKCLELVLLYGVTPEVEQRQREVIIEHFADNPAPLDEFRNADYAMRMISQYNKTYPRELFELCRGTDGEPLVEVGFKYPLGTVDIGRTCPYPPELLLGPDYTERGGLTINRVYVIWTGRIDAVISDNGTWVMDHKTSSVGGDQFFQDFQLSSQMHGYGWAGQQLLQRPITGMMVNALFTRKPTATGKSIEFRRQKFPYTQEQYSEWQENTLLLITNFLNALTLGSFPMETKWCFGKYGRCTYHDVCLTNRALRSAVLHSELYRDVTWNPLD